MCHIELGLYTADGIAFDEPGVSKGTLALADCHLHDNPSVPKA